MVLEQRLSRKIRDENTENEITTDNEKISIRCDDFAIISFLGFFDVRSRVEPNSRLTVENYYRHAIRETHNDVP